MLRNGAAWQILSPEPALGLAIGSGRGLLALPFLDRGVFGRFWLLQPFVSWRHLARPGLPSLGFLRRCEAVHLGRAALGELCSGSRAGVLAGVARLVRTRGLLIEHVGVATLREGDVVLGFLLGLGSHGEASCDFGRL